MAKATAKKAAEKAKVQPETKYGFTAAAITKDRQDGLSWAKIAEKRELGSPSSARRAWLVLVGTPHTEAPQLDKGGRPAGSGKGNDESNGGNGFDSVDLTDCTTLAQVRKLIGGGDVRVAPLRKGGQVRTLGARKVQKLNLDAGTVDVIGADGKAHTVALGKVQGARAAK
jgi:hypothetical protein